MENIKQSKLSNHLIDAIVEGVRKRKGHEIIDLDLTQLENTECNHFIICHGKSSTQVEAIARSIEDTVKEFTGEHVWHTDGYRNAQWILLDYSNIIVHIFHEEWRKHYDLEQLWSDAKIKKFKSEN